MTSQTIPTNLKVDLAAMATFGQIPIKKISVKFLFCFNDHLQCNVVNEMNKIFSRKLSKFFKKYFYMVRIKEISCDHCFYKGLRAAAFGRTLGHLGIVIFLQACV